MANFNASFEKSILKELAQQFPKYKEHLENIINNMIDLAEPFKNKYYYHPKMEGKHSIKILLPLVVPEMPKEYEKLNIKNGVDAMQAFSDLATIRDIKKINKIRKDLEEYCALDTLAMVRIHEKLLKFYESP